LHPGNPWWSDPSPPHGRNNIASVAADFDFLAILRFGPLFRLDWVCVPSFAFPPVDGYVPACHSLVAQYSSSVH
jgi:hypothetical protein